MLVQYFGLTQTERLPSPPPLPLLKLQTDHNSKTAQKTDIITHKLFWSLIDPAEQLEEGVQKNPRLWNGQATN